MTVDSALRSAGGIIAFMHAVSSTPHVRACDLLGMAIALDTLAYARRLREAGFSDAQAEGQAQALAAAMTDALATKIDLRELEFRMDARFALLEVRMAEFEKRVNARFDHSERHADARLDARLADLERRVTVRMLAGVAAVSALVKLL